MNRLQLPYNKVFTFQNSKISYRVMGKGKPVVLLHGSLTHDGWGRFDTELSKFYKLYIIDLPGFGSSDTLKRKLHNTDLYCEVLCSFLKQLKLEKVPLIALSWGTVIAAKTALKGCAKGTLILAATPGKPSGIMFEVTNAIPVKLKRFLVSTNVGKKFMLVPVIRQNISDNNQATDEEIIGMLNHTDPSAIVDTNYKREIGQELPAIISKLKNTIHYVYGEYDPMQNDTRSFVNEYITISGAGHNLFYSQPKKTAEAIKKILK